MYDEGEGVAENDATAVEWFTRSAEQGYSYSQSQLGVMYEQKMIHETAVKWYSLAAEQGVADAQSECSAQTIPPLISGGKTSGAKR